MKRFLAFHGNNYYPGGGWYDFVGSFADKQEAIAAVISSAEKNLLKGRTMLWENQWGHVVDAETDCEVWDHSEPFCNSRKRR